MVTENKTVKTFITIVDVYSSISNVTYATIPKLSNVCSSCKWKTTEQQKHLTLIDVDLLISNATCVTMPKYQMYVVEVVVTDPLKSSPSFIFSPPTVTDLYSTHHIVTRVTMNHWFAAELWCADISNAVVRNIASQTCLLSEATAFHIHAHLITENNSSLALCIKMYHA